MNRQDDEDANAAEQARLDMLRQLLEKEKQTQAELWAGDYDGVRGKPPDWVPESRVSQFFGARDEAIAAFGFAPDSLLRAVDAYPSFIPSEIFYDKQRLTAYGHTVGYLSELRDCVALGPEQGLIILSGRHAYQGFQQYQGSKKSRKDALAILMERTYDHLCESDSGRVPTWTKVLEHLLDHDDPDEFKRTIQEISSEAEQIHWRDRRDSEKETSFASFRDRLTKIKKSRR